MYYLWAVYFLDFQTSVEIDGWLTGAERGEVGKCLNERIGSDNVCPGF